MLKICFEKSGKTNKEMLEKKFFKNVEETIEN